MEMWSLLAVFMVGNATWFLAYVVAIWLGFRMTNNIYSTADAPIVGKILLSIYCLTVTAFMTLLTLNTNKPLRDIASGLEVSEKHKLCLQRRRHSSQKLEPHLLSTPFKWRSSLQSSLCSCSRCGWISRPSFKAMDYRKIGGSPLLHYSWSCSRPT